MRDNLLYKLEYTEDPVTFVKDRKNDEFEEPKEKQSIRFQCECGSTVCRNHAEKHKGAELHKKRIVRQYMAYRFKTFYKLV